MNLKLKLKKIQLLTLCLCLLLGLAAGFYPWVQEPLTEDLQDQAADAAAKSYHKGLLALQLAASQNEQAATHLDEAARFFQLALNQSAGEGRIQTEVQNKSLFNLALVRFESAKGEKDPAKQHQLLNKASQNLQDLLTLSGERQPKAVQLLYQAEKASAAIKLQQRMTIFQKAMQTEIYPLLLEIETEEEKRQKMLLQIEKEPLNLSLRFKYTEVKEVNRARNLALQQKINQQN